MVERRRHKRRWWSRWLYAPIPLDSIEQEAERVSRRAWPWLRWTLVALAVAAVAAGVWWWRWSNTPTYAPRYRAEALCFLLAEKPVFAPPMHVESDAAMVRGRFSADTPPPIAIRETMHLRDDMVLSERRESVGDFDVAVMWLRLPTGNGGHWLVVGWMEDSDLAMCSFRFAGDPTDLTTDQILWGRRLTDRVLQAEYFHTGSVPDVRWRPVDGNSLPSFGPPATR
ncbi:MAG: hypothetical protein ACHQ52_06130 [Candidatus Eisenbacteria bacterium]